MPAPSSCTPCCVEAVTTNIPGTEGGNAFATLSANLTLPAVNATVVANVTNTNWMAVGEVIFASDDIDWGHFQVQSIGSVTQVTLVFLGNEGDGSPGAVIDSGSRVVPSGTQQAITFPISVANGGTGQITAPLALAAILSGAPLPIANGGTGQITAPLALAALGVGQDATVDTSAGLVYDILNAATAITGVAATCPTTGLYLILAHVTVDYAAATFLSNRTLTISIRNVTAGANLVTCVRSSGIFTLLTQPSQDYVLPFTTQSLTASDSIQLWISFDTVQSQGTSRVSSASLALVPIAI